MSHDDPSDADGPQDGPYAPHGLPPLTGVCGEMEHAVMATLLDAGWWGRRRFPLTPDGGLDLDQESEVVFTSTDWMFRMQQLARVAVNSIAPELLEAMQQLDAYRLTYGPPPRAPRATDPDGPENAESLRRMAAYINTQLREGNPPRVGEDMNALLHEVFGVLFKLLRLVRHPDAVWGLREVCAILARAWWPVGKGEDFERAMFPQAWARTHPEEARGAAREPGS